MSEIQKMYKNAGIEQTQDITCGDCEFLNYFEEKKPCKSCTQYGIKKYPPFTAEKQISILQFCLKWGQVHILEGIDNEYRIENYCYRQGYQPTLADAIANYINEKWEKLTPEEKQQVKGILE